MTDIKELPWPGYDPNEWSRTHSRHGHTSRLNGSKSTPTYKSWQAMRARCRYVDRDPEHKYVNRGISCDPAWNSFEQFLSDMGERPAGTTLDRIDNNANYGPGNCRWATATQQARNRRNAKLTYAQAVDVAVLVHLGVPATVVAKEYGTSESLPREIAKGRSWKDANDKALELVEWLKS